MSWIPTLLPWQWWIMGAIPAGIVLLYFLKLKREPVEVPSTYLWSRTIEDLHVNSLLQRLRRNLLLLLQLLAVALAILALMRPGVRGETTGQGRSVFLLDTSASMGATDVEGHDNRFEQARGMIKERIEAMSDSDEAMLVSFSDRPTVLQSFTSDRGRLRDALSRAELTTRPTDLLGALKAADGLANPRRTSEAGTTDVQVADEKPADLLIFSDGGFQTASQRTLKVGVDANLEILARWLMDVGYQPSDNVKLRSEFRKQIGMLDVFPPTGSRLDKPARIRWNGDKVTSIQTYDPEDGNILDEVVELMLPALDMVNDPVADFDLGYLSPTYIAIGSGSVRNLGIIAFSAERDFERPSEVQAFATVVNMGAKPATGAATLYIGDTLYEASAISLDPGEQVGLSFSLDSEDAAALTLRLEGANNQKWSDDFPLDDVAYAGLTPLRTVSVLVITPGNTPLKLALGTESADKISIREFMPPSFLTTEDYKKRAAAGVDDLIIYDRCAPTEMPPTNTFFIGSLPVSEGWSWATEAGQVVLIDMDRTHPVMQYVELYSLLIFSGRGIKGPPGTMELVGADVGSMMSLAPREGYQDMVLGFEIITQDDEGTVQTNTNWYAERAWPVFMLNVLRYLAGAADASGAPSFRPGETVRLRVESAIDAVMVRRIGSEGQKLSTGPSGMVEVIDTDVVGNYEVKAEDRLVDLFAVNLFDRRESDVSTAPSVDLGYEEVGAETSGIEQRQEYWRWALLLMLGLLTAEWWLYAKRVA